MVDYSLLGNLPNAGQGFMNGYTQSRDMLRDEAGRNALSQYAINPNDPQAMNALAQADPQTALRARMEQQQRAVLQQKQQQDMAEQGIKTAGQLALQVAGLPEEQRAQAWDQSIDQLASSFPGAAQYKGKYSPDTLRYVLAQAGLGDEYARMTQERVGGTPEGGFFRIPGYGQTQAAAPSSGPQVGAVVGAHRYKGGNPNDPASWEAAGGAAPSGTGGFQPEGN